MRPRPALDLTIRIAAALALASPLAACGTDPEIFASRPQPTAQFADVPYASWSDDEPDFRLFPGDELDVQVPSAPELNKVVVVQPDGRVSLPLIEPVMVADRSVVVAESMISTAYASQLRHPRVSISVRPTPLKVFVGGDVDRPGVYDMPGDINALQAILMAGGFRDTARRSQVVLIRRGAAGKPMMRTVDLLRAISDPGHFDMAPLRRLDIIYVPKTGVAETGVFVQQYIHNVVPVSFGFSYASGGLNTF